MEIKPKYKHSSIKKSFLMSILLVLSGLSMYAQPNTLYFLDRIHQSNQLNPAITGSCNGYFNLPALSGIYINAANTGFDYNDLIHAGTGLLADSLVIDIENIKTKLGKSNAVLIENNLPIFGFGFWSGHSYITFEISNKTKASVIYPETLVSLTGGNTEFIGSGNPLVIDRFGPDVMNYTEFALGWAKKLTHRFTFGTKIKLLSGNAAVKNKSTNIELYTEETTYAMQLKTDVKFNISAPLEFTYDENGLISDAQYDDSQIVSDLMPNKNFGFGLDFGGIYQLNDKIKLYASLIDLGFIRWSKNSQSLYQSGTFEFSGLSLDSVWSESDYNEMAAIGDSLSEFFHFAHEEKGFTSMLNTNLYIGGTYEVARFMNVGLLSRTYLYGNKMHQAFTASANFNPGRSFTASLSYSIMNREYKNLGLGFGLKLGPMQLVLITDNIYTALMPKNSKTANFMFGLNWNFGCGKRDNFSMLNNNMPDKKTDFM